MKIHLLGVSHKSAPIQLRERLAIAPAALPEAARRLAARPGVREGMVLSTCNRVELLAFSEPAAGSGGDLVGFFREYLGVQPEELRSHLYHYQEQEAVRHVFRVASSLDSMVLGEPQILGQLKEAYAAARSAGAVGSALERLLQSAFSTAKKVRTETRIGAASVSISSVAVDLARRIFGSLEGKCVLLVGAGKMSELAARHLVRQGARSILIANRTHERASQLAQQFGGRAIPFDDLHAEADQADIVITSTGAPTPIFRREHAQRFLQRRKNRPMFFIDIAVPRDVAAEVNKLEGVFLYDIDDLQSVAASHIDQRRDEAQHAEQIVAREVARYEQGAQTLTAAPAIVALQRSFEQVREAEHRRLQPRLQSLTPEQREAVESLTRGLINKLLHPPLQALKSAARAGDSSLAEAARNLFALNSAEAATHPSPDSEPELSSEPESAPEPVSILAGRRSRR